VISNLLKWHWWRFNGEGYFWGMLSGIVPALIFPLITDTLDLYYFPVILLISLVGCIIGSYASPPTPEKVLLHFYEKTRPWGFWKPVYEKMIAQNQAFKRNTNFSRDMVNVLIGTAAQTILVIIPLYWILHQSSSLFISIGILIGCVILLKINWWNKLDNEFHQTN